ncbi:hypothetical protein ES703_108188 [subsurface metagenome]
MRKGLKVRMSCPVCGQPIFAKSLEGHLERVHELTGLVTLRLHPTSSYRHEPEGEVVELAPPEGKEEGKEGKEAATATTPEPEAKAETAPKTEPVAEPAPEPAPEPAIKPKKTGKK